MKIKLEKYNPAWKNQFESIKIELVNAVGFLYPHIEHIGSTSVNGLSAKPIIDILVGLEHAEWLDDVIDPLLEHDYVYYPVFNEMMPYRRFFVKHKSQIDRSKIANIINNEQDIPTSTDEHDSRAAHVHVLTYNSEHWIRHIAFRNYLRAHAGVREEYQRLKEKLSAKEWLDGNDYNSAKNDFIKIEEKRAVDWFIKKGNR